MWNSRSKSLIGMSMTDEEMSSLSDIYLVLGEKDHSKHTNYILQFLWRDVVGPYYTSDKTVNGKFVLACIYDVLQHPWFQNERFGV